MCLIELGSASNTLFCGQTDGPKIPKILGIFGFLLGNVTFPKGIGKFWPWLGTPPFRKMQPRFFVHMGKTSQLAESINGLATMYGKLLTRQSERDLPNTNFAKGIQKGKLMARDFRGVLLIMAAVLASAEGRRLLFKRKKFGGEAGLKDWTLLVELLLEWEAYLGQRKMKRKDVVRMAKKHRFIMYVMKQVADRTTGMGLKLMKFHAVIHLIFDMLLYGTPSEFDTGSNESHHKESKCAARLTQRKESTFNQQTATRLTEFLCIDLAMEELLHDRCVWEYFHAEEAMEEDPVDAGHDGTETTDQEATHATDPEDYPWGFGGRNDGSDRRNSNPHLRGLRQ